jgi:hypothetical protein
MTIKLQQDYMVISQVDTKVITVLKYAAMQRHNMATKGHCLPELNILQLLL